MRFGALAFVCVALPHVAEAQCQGTIDLKQFVLLAESYRAGDDAPVAVLVDCAPSLALINDQLAENRVLVAKARTPEARYQQLRLAPRLIPAAAMLLYDAARQTLREGRLNFREYLGTAGLVLQVPRDATDSFAAEWYAAVARWLRVRQYVGDAERLLASARQWLPDEPRVLYESGVTAELLATAYARREHVRGVPVPRNEPPPPRGDPEKELARAAEWLRSMPDFLPMSDLASIRLAHVLLLQGHTTEVVSLGDALTARGSDPAVAYVANVLSGSALEREGRFRDAALRYQLAFARFPAGQSARIALSEVLQRDGRHEEARAVVEALLDMPEEPREPWWTLMLDSEPHLNGVFKQLRDWVRQ